MIQLYYYQNFAFNEMLTFENYGKRQYLLTSEYSE